MPTKKQIHVEVHFSPAKLEEMQLKDKNIVVIDLLTGMISVAMALHNGAKEIIPVSNIESAVKISGSLYGGVTLRAGERNGKMIEGFNLGNSPNEYKEDTVKGKSIIFMTTNGSGAMVKGRHAKNLVVAGFVNLTSTVSFLKELAGDFMIICAGKENDFCIEDAVCAGKIINKLESEIDAELLPNDAGFAAATLDKMLGKNILKVLKNSGHGNYLTDIGFADDLKVCAEVDSIPILPILSGNVIRLAKETSKSAVGVKE